MITPVKPQAQQRSRRLRHYLINLVLLLSLLLQAQSCQDRSYRKEAEMPDTKVTKRTNRRDRGVIPLPISPNQSVIPLPAGSSTFQGPMANTTLTNYPQNATAALRGNRRDRGRGGMTWQEDPFVAGLMGTPLPMAINAPMDAMAPQYRPVNFPKPETFRPTRAGRMGRPGTGVPEASRMIMPVPDEIAAFYNQLYTAPDNEAWDQNAPEGGYPGQTLYPRRWTDNTARDTLAERSRIRENHWDYIYKEYLARMAEHLFDTVPSMGGGGPGTDWWGDGGSGGGGGGGYGNPAFNAWMSRLLSWNVNR